MQITSRLIRRSFLALAPVLIFGAWLAANGLMARPGASKQGLSPDFAAQRPIPAHDSLWIEELTWLEVRDALAAGNDTVIVPAGGIEQNGPYAVTGKHNVILRATAPAIARKLGNALIAPIIPFVPEGSIDPPSGHMRYPGTISVNEATYRALLRDTARAVAVHGFRCIVFIGDSGGNQDGMKDVAEELNAQWRGSDRQVIYVPEYYDWDDRAQWLARHGYEEIEQGYHDELSVETIMLAVDPASIRMTERLSAGLFSINGVNLQPTEKSISAALGLINHIADRSVEAINRRRR